MTRNEARDDEIERLARAGFSNRQIAIMAKCSSQNIDQIQRRINADAQASRDRYLSGMENFRRWQEYRRTGIPPYRAKNHKP